MYSAWSSDHIFKLLALVEKYPVIWDMNSKDYRNRDLKEAAFNEIAKELDQPSDEVKKKLQSLRSAFMREINQCQKRLKSGAGADQVFRAVKWKYFSAMKFMYKASVSQSGSVDILVSKNRLFLFYFHKSLIFLQIP